MEKRLFHIPSFAEAADTPRGLGLGLGEALGWDAIQVTTKAGPHSLQLFSK